MLTGLVTDSPGDGRNLYEPGLVVDAVIRLLVAERVPVTVNSVSRAEESAQRLLRDLGVQPAAASPNRVAWQAIADAITGGIQ